MARPRKYLTEEDRRAARRETDRRYKTRRRARERPVGTFLAIDGEGEQDRYILLGSSRDWIANRDGLSSRECLCYLLRPQPAGTIRVAFGLGYDVTHWTRDLPDDLQLALWQGKEVEWEGLILRYIPRKLFTIRARGRKVTIYDVWSFFGTSFEQACERHLGEVPEILTEGKAARADWSAWSLESIRGYHQTECELLERLMTRLAETLTDRLPGLPSLRPAGWHGPGAVAARVLRHAEVGREVWPERTYPDDLRTIFAQAYFGGRIEAFGAGTFEGEVYRYDLRSAYPDAIRRLPRLRYRWRHVQEYWPGPYFAVWHVRWDLRPYVEHAGLPGPFPWRDSEGYVIFRAEGDGWYWGPEVEVALRCYPGIEILEGWVMEGDYDYPLRGLVERLYNLRADLVRAGDPREYALKLALNSLYGKMAQRDGTPRFRSIAWAGYVTSWTRARVLEAMMQVPYATLAVMTDGFLSVVPLNLPLGRGLGEWEEARYDGALILLPGVYRLGRADDPLRVERWRGYNVREFPWEYVLQRVRSEGKALISCPLFVSPPLAILCPNIYGGKRGQIIRQNRAIVPLVSHKRRFRIADDGGPSPSADLSCQWIGTDMVAGPPDFWPPASAPYTAFAPDPIEELIRTGLEEAGGIPAAAG